VEQREEDGGSSSKLLLHEEGVTADQTPGSNGDGGGRHRQAKMADGEREREQVGE
jgi:hypothetical protein